MRKVLSLAFLPIQLWLVSGCTQSADANKLLQKQNAANGHMRQCIILAQRYEFEHIESCVKVANYIWGNRSSDACGTSNSLFCQRVRRKDDEIGYGYWAAVATSLARDRKPDGRAFYLRPRSLEKAFAKCMTRNAQVSAVQRPCIRVEEQDNLIPPIL